MLIAITLILLVLGSILFHFLSPWWFTPLASNWGTIDDTILITFWVTGIVFIAVNLFLAYCVVRYRYSKDRKADYEPENTKLEVWLTVITSIGVAAMLAPGLVVWAKFVEVPDDAIIVEAVGQQWEWSFRYPGNDGKLGTSSANLISDDNPYGINPNDINGQDDIIVSGDEMHLPVDKPVKILLRSKDVLHDFAVAQFRVKMDLVPGMVTYVWLTPTETGTYEILCEELCGIGHHTMRSKVIVEQERDYHRWLGSQSTFAQINAQAPGDAAAGEAHYGVCAACHGAQGEGNVALNAPKLSGQEDWYIKRQLLNFKTGLRGAHEKDIFGKQMAPMATTLADATAINNVIAYIGSLPDNPASHTIQGNATRGKKHFQACGLCHGKDAQGIEALNAPKLAGLNDWYIETQLKNFEQGIRGSHANDRYGRQMESMASTLNDEQTIKDIIAYLNTK